MASTTAGGFLTGETRHGTSTLNMVPNQVAPNLTVAKVSDAGPHLGLQPARPANVIVDVVGYFRL